MTELQKLFERLRERESISYLCNVSCEFSELWEKDRTKIREKATIFLKEYDNDIYSLGFINDSWNEVLFIGGSSGIVRLDFLEWCISKGYETINELFT